MKTSENFFHVWGGISGCQSLLQLLLTEGYTARQVPLPLLTKLTSDTVARRFNIPQKGRLAIGKYADLALVNLQAQIILQASDLHYRHAHSPYIGRTLQGQIVQTLVRGITVYKDGQFSATPQGQLLIPF
jgi:allantoinase